MADTGRDSALSGFDPVSRFGGRDGSAAVTLSVIGDLLLYQLAAWPDTLAPVGAVAAELAGAERAPPPRRAAPGTRAALLRVEPLAWWLVGDADETSIALPALDAAQGTALDLSHSRCRVRVAGARAATLLNRYLPLDLRAPACPVDGVASSAFHHVGVTLWRRGDDDYELFLPRGYAASLWQLLLESAAQFDLDGI